MDSMTDVACAVYAGAKRDKSKVKPKISDRSKGRAAVTRTRKKEKGKKNSGESSSDRGSDIDEANLLEVPWVTDNEDEEVTAVRTKCRELVRSEIRMKGAMVGGSEGTVVAYGGFEEFGLDGAEGGNYECTYYEEFLDIPIMNDDDFEYDEEGSPITTSEDSEGEHGRRRKSTTVYFDPTIEDPKFQLDMVFIDKEQISSAIDRHACVHKREVDVVKSDSKRVRVACTECHRFGHNSRTCALKKAKAVMKQANPGHSIDTYFDEQQCRFVLNNNPGQPSLLAATISDQNRASGSTMSAIARVGSPDVVTSPKRRGRGRGIGCGIVISTQESQASS